MPPTTADDSAWNIQKAIFNRLGTDESLQTLLAEGAESVFDHVPQGSAFPYVALGDFSAQPMDTAAMQGRESMVTIHSFSRRTGMKELKDIMAAISAALQDADMAVEGHHLVLCRETRLDAFLESDGETRHGIQTFRLITEPAL